MQQRGVPLEIIQSHVEIALPAGHDKNEAIRALIHKYGHEHIDFSGGARADPNDGTVANSA